MTVTITRSVTLAISLIGSSLVASTARATDYDVGEGQDFTTIASVPWASLVAGDTVRIHWRATPYAEQWGITASGTDGNPIRVVGVPSDQGELPVVDGGGASEGPDAHPRGLISVRGGAQYVSIEGLELRGASVDNGYSDAASAIYVEDGDHVEFVGLVIHDCGNGFFAAPDASDVRLAGSYVYGNGNDGSIYEHNIYTESNGILFEYNRLGPLRDAALGTNLKDRSANTIVRYNWIEGGNRALDLVEPEDGADQYGDVAETAPVFVYGNVLIKRDDAPTNSQVVHFGGDLDSGRERRNLVFYANTVFSTRPITTAFFLNAAEPSAIVVDNVFFSVAGGSSLRLFDTDTSSALTGSLSHNFLGDGWVLSNDGGLAFPGFAQDGNLEGADPGFVSIDGEDLHLVGDAVVRDAGADLPPETADHPVEREFAMGAAGPTTVPRAIVGAIDMGAFEFCETDCDVPDPTGGVDDSGGADAGTGGDGTGPGGDGATAGPGEGGSQGGATEGGGGSITSANDAGGSSSGAADDGSSGCGCRSSGTPAPLALLLAFGLRRRRARG